MLDDHLGHRPPAPAERDEHLGLEEVASTSYLERTQVRGPVELHADDVPDRQLEHEAQSRRVQLRDEHATQRIASRYATADNERHVVARVPRRDPLRRVLIAE